MTQAIQRKILRVNLNNQQVTRETIAEKDVELFLGGRALGDLLLYNELAPGIDPLSPENKLIFGTGPLTGTNTVGSSRYVVLTKSPLTGLYLSSLAGGYFAPELRRSGHDFVIVEGKSPHPVYVAILDNMVEIRDASRLWGMTTSNTQEFIKSEVGDNNLRIACIGPAGENLVLFASIISERRAVGRGGAGAVMGSKNLKAIAVRGTGKVIVANPRAFTTAIKHALGDLAQRTDISMAFPVYGSMSAMPALNTGGVIPWRNWQDAGSEKCKALFAQTWRDKYVRKDLFCAPPCNLKCSKITLAREGPHAGVVCEGPEYETEYALGACCEITDETAIIEADALCDQYGIDTISMGVSLGFVMECYEKGIITSKDTRGLEIRFGRADLLARLIRDTAYRRGFGELLSLGTKRMAEKFDKGAEAFAMHCKGMELGGYDPRAARSLALVFACGSRGGCHKSGGSCNAQALKELRTGEARFSNEGKAELTKTTREWRVVADSAIMCVFPQTAVTNATIAELLSAATGFTYNPETLYTIGERGSNVERAFNVREGLRRGWDTLPRRLLTESVQSGSTKGQIVELETLLDDFYQLCGWDIKTGIPTSTSLNQLGLPQIARDMERYCR